MMTQALAIGIVGGMSPESTVTYYRHIIRRHQAERRDHNYPRIVIASVSFQQYVDWQHQGEWEEIARGLEKEFDAVAAAGADFAILATNTMHKVLPAISSPVPVLSVLDAITAEAKTKGVWRLGLTGTRFTMSDGFYRRDLEDRGLSVLLPTESEQERIHRIIYDELIYGNVDGSSANEFTGIANSLLKRGAEAVILGCTELELLVRSTHSMIPMLESTQIHADAAWEVSIAGDASHHLLSPSLPSRRRP